MVETEMQRGTGGTGTESRRGSDKRKRKSIMPRRSAEESNFERPGDSVTREKILKA